MLLVSRPKLFQLGQEVLEELHAILLAWPRVNLQLRLRQGYSELKVAVDLCSAPDDV